MQRDVATPEAYLALVPPAQRALLDHLRGLVLEATPGLKEGIRWGMLCYEDSGALFALAAQKHYVGLYVMATQALRDMEHELKPLDHGKGCLRFKKLDAVPTEVIRRLLVHASAVHERECRQTD